MVGSPLVPVFGRRLYRRRAAGIFDFSGEQLFYSAGSVSYTHLTLPTKRIVEISVVDASLKKKNGRKYDGVQHQ